MTPSGLEPTTFRFVAKYLKHCATISGPHCGWTLPSTCGQGLEKFEIIIGFIILVYYYYYHYHLFIL
jgi:hypothetical protein